MSIAISVVCLVVFLWQAGLPEDAFQLAVYRFGMIPALVTGAAPTPPEIAGLQPTAAMVSAMFLHGSWAHLTSNALFLLIFGSNVEHRLGHAVFVGFYLGCGLVAAVVQILPDPASIVPMIGASGAVSGVLGAYAVWFPQARILVFTPFSFFFLHHLRAVWLLGLWFALQLVSALVTPPSTEGVAFWAHVGGFLAGAAIALALGPPARGAAAPSRGPWG